MFIALVTIHFHAKLDYDITQELYNLIAGIPSTIVSTLIHSPQILYTFAKSTLIKYPNCIVKSLLIIIVVHVDVQLPIFHKFGLIKILACSYMQVIAGT